VYCPKCFNSTLALNNRGVVDLIINSKQMDAGRFLFNLESNNREKIIQDFRLKLEEFFEWYSGFKNIEPIQYVEVCTADFKCTNCQYVPGLKNRYSIIDSLIPQKIMIQSLQELSTKYHLELKLKASS